MNLLAGSGQEDNEDTGGGREWRRRGRFGSRGEKWFALLN